MYIVDDVRSSYLLSYLYNINSGFVRRVLHTQSAGERPQDAGANGPPCYNSSYLQATSRHNSWPTANNLRRASTNNVNNNNSRWCCQLHHQRSAENYSPPKSCFGNSKPLPLGSLAYIMCTAPPQFVLSMWLKRFFVNTVEERMAGSHSLTECDSGSECFI